MTTETSTTPNAQRLLWAGFMAILAAGVGFAIRGAILGQWADKYGFTMTELGQITGGGLFAFGLIILVSAFLADAIGYGRLMFLGFVTHLASAAITLATGAAFTAWGKDAAYYCLFWGMFLFAIGNGICEAVVNPLVATLFPKNKTHYLNILHAGWPGGLILGGLLSYFMNPDEGKAVTWEIQMTLFLVPVAAYGLMLLGQKFPKSEASQAGVSMGVMFAQLLAPVMIALLVIHAMVGYVELGTDSWMTKMTTALTNSKQNAVLLFTYTSALMFAMRFFAGPIVEKTSPLGLLFVSGLLGFVGLQLLGNATSMLLCIVAVTVYAAGKTFLWPTMLAVVSEQFPKGGAIAIGAIGGIGMLSAGLLGGPGIGFKIDYNASHSLRTEAPSVFDRYKAPKEDHFLMYSVNGLDGSKVAVLEDDGKQLAQDGKTLEKIGKTDENHQELAKWWMDAEKSKSEDEPKVVAAIVFGSRMALKLTSYVPLAMAACYLLLLLYFKTKGGYKAQHVEQIYGEN